VLKQRRGSRLSSVVRIVAHSGHPSRVPSGRASSAPSGLVAKSDSFTSLQLQPMNHAQIVERRCLAQCSSSAARQSNWDRVQGDSRFDSPRIIYTHCTPF
jgi:hypothetical protein